MYIQVVNRLLLWAQDLPGAASQDEKQLKSKRRTGSEGPLKDTQAPAEWLSPASFKSAAPRCHHVDGLPPSNMNIWAQCWELRYRGELTQARSCLLSFLGEGGGRRQE